MRRRVPAKRASTGRRIVAGKTTVTKVALDDSPCAIQVSRDGKRLLVLLPYEIWVVNASSFELERTIEIPAAAPSVAQFSDDGDLWIGGHHLHRGNMFVSRHTKVGSKLGGFVDHVCMVRKGLMCGVGSQGEVLWSLEKQAPVHRRKTSEHVVYGLVSTSDGRAVWVDGHSRAWVIDPDHPEGYMQLKLRATSQEDVPHEGFVAIAKTSQGRIILAARDGAVGWTPRRLRIEREYVPKMSRRGALPLAVGGDERWVYVLRPRGVLQRFLIAQPPADPDADEEPLPLPEAQECRLRAPASCLAVLSGNTTTLVLGGPRGDGQLGDLWREDPEKLTWKSLQLQTRTLVEPQPPAPSASRRPDFTPTKSKVKGPGLHTLKVDDVLKLSPETALVTVRTGTLIERATTRMPCADVMPGDALLLPAMVRTHDGTARPALLLWPGLPDMDAPPLPLQWLTWGDNPRGWMPLTTPEIRRQGWTRSQLFPWQVAIATLPDVAGNRATIPDRWVDKAVFEAMRRECKKLLKVLW